MPDISLCFQVRYAVQGFGILKLFSKLSYQVPHSRLMQLLA